MMKFALARAFTLVTVIAVAGSAAVRAVSPPGQGTTTVKAADRALLDRYCVTCHNDSLRTGELTLQGLDVSDVGRNPAVWEKVLGKLRTGGMPPPGRPRPTEGEAAPLVSWLETSLDRVAHDNPNPGRPAVHRLNRTEYGHAIRDLLDLEVDVASLLPADDSGGGFDNIADVLTISPLFLERYMSAARKVSRLAIGDPAVRAVQYRVPRTLVQDGRTDEDLPLGTRGGVAMRHYFPMDGEYLIKLRMKRNSIDEIRGLLHTYRLDVLIDGQRVKSFQVGGGGPKTGGREEPKATYEALLTYLTHADDAMEFRLSVTAGPHVVGVTFPSQSAEIEGPPEILNQPKSWNYFLAKLGLAGIGTVEIRGPYHVAGPGQTPSRSRIFTCRPAPGASETEAHGCARQIISTLARRAFRRPLTAEDLQTLLEFYESGRSTGGFEAGIALALQRILVSPYFLFRVEQDPAGIAPGTPYRLADLELASRLSFFLWSSIPDDQLLDVASRGELSSPGVLDREARRMLVDPRSDALVSNFAAQWLGTRNLAFAEPNEDLFPEFDENLRRAFLRETELFVQSVLREDRSAFDLLTANYTYVNERLARHYGIPNVRGNWFRRVTLGPDQARAGILGHGSVLTVTSLATRTSPVNRGKWILENVLGTPPPPPPPDIPALEEEDTDGKALSMREAMAVHRRNPVCAACHAKMDPLGLALENFDAIGAWRTKAESNEVIDASVELPGGATFTGPTGLRQVLLSTSEQFAETVIEKLLMYATGRGLDYYDRPVIRSIARDAAGDGSRLSSLVLGVVRSAPFQMRRSADRPAEATVASHR